MADSTLAAIRTKVRRLTRSPSTQQLSNATLDEYINTFVLYDMPEHLRLFSLRTTFEFVCSPYIDTYETNTDYSEDQFYNFKNKYSAIRPPVYVAGKEAAFFPDRTTFFGVYPQVESIQALSTQGDGATTSFSGTLTNIPVIPRHVSFMARGNQDQSLYLVDVPVVDAFGNPTTDGNFYSLQDPPPDTPPTSTESDNTINYVTGVYTITFDAAPKASTDITSQTLPYVAAQPQAVLFYDNKIVLRPVPDKPYKISLEADIQPTELLLTTDSPDLEQWWQYIAYGASKKIFEDRMDMDSVQMIMPEFKTQERLALRRTIVQQTNERTATIYSEQTSLGAFNNNFPNGPY